MIQTQLPVLFKRTKNGAVQQWQIVIENDSYHTIEGLYSHKLTKSLPTIVVGKNIGKSNQTDSCEQAYKDAQSKHAKQLKTGYCEDIDKIDNTGFLSPQLAKSFKDYRDKIKYPVGVQIKFNGFCCIATRNGLFTRKNERYLSVPHIEQSLKEFFKKYPDAYLHGELFNEDFRQELNQISRLCRKTVHITSEDLQQSERLIRYYCYDGYNFGGTTIMSHYLERAAAIYQELNSNPYYCKVDTEVVQSEIELNKLYERFVANLHEGAIVRILNTPYVHKRTGNLLKLKPTDTEEFFVSDILEGTGNWQGLAKSIVCQMPNSKIFNAAFKGTMQQAKILLENKHLYINKSHTISFNGYTGLNTPNFAQFDYNNCLSEII